MKVKMSRVNLKHRQVGLNQEKSQSNINKEQVKALAQLCFQIYTINNQNTGGNNNEPINN